MTTVNDLDKIVVRKRHKNKEIERAIKFAERFEGLLRTAFIKQKRNRGTR